LINQPERLLCLFVAGAAYWWFFEYLNRFVQDWDYTRGLELTPWQYLIAATPPFATVLPAVLCTVDLLRSFDGLHRVYGRVPMLRMPYPRFAAGFVLGAGGVSLAGIGVWAIDFQYQRIERAQSCILRIPHGGLAPDRLPGIGIVDLRLFLGNVERL
jgi:hypothetical protein